ncbi:MAG TPA: hypothetical protein VD902_19165 [Symbiobacteriaceae bacterium]|nr:hypothetical protein [Symbiobacteriaceae bacterium]
MATAPEQKVRTPEGHFRTLFYAAVFRLLHRLRQITGADDDLDGLLERFPFLRGYLEEMRLHLPSGATWSESMTWWEAEEQAWEQSATDPHLPLRALLTEGGLDRAARTAFMLAGLVEEDSRFGNLFAHLQQPLGQRRPTAGLLERLAGEEGAWRRLLPTGLAEVVNPGAPRPEWELIVPSILWEAARGWTDLSAPWCRYRPPQNLQPVERLVLPPDLEEHLSNLPSVLTAGQARMAVLRGSAGSERLEAFGGRPGHKPGVARGRISPDRKGAQRAPHRSPQRASEGHSHDPV